MENISILEAITKFVRNLHIRIFIAKVVCYEKMTDVNLVEGDIVEICHKNLAITFCWEDITLVNTSCGDVLFITDDIDDVTFISFLTKLWRLL